MAILEDRKGWPIGVGLAVLAVSMAPKIAKAGRPLMKRAIKGYLTFQERAKEIAAESGERMQDLYAEAKHEHEQEIAATQTESDLMPEPQMAEATAPVEGGRRAPRTETTSITEEEDIEG